MSAGTGVCRVWYGHPMDGGTSIGTAFAVAPAAFLTCGHVLDSIDFLRAEKGGSAHLSGQAFDAPVPVQIELRPIDADIRSGEHDFALLCIDPSLAVATMNVTRVRLLERWGTDATFTFAGYAGGDRDREKQGLTVGSGRVSSRFGPSATVILGAHAAQGMSGGPVRLDDEVVGMLKARSPLEGEVDIVTSHQFAPFLKRQGIAVEPLSLTGEAFHLPPEGASQDELVNYIQSVTPTSAMPVAPFSVLELADALSRAYPMEIQAYAVFDLANLLRTRADQRKTALSLEMTYPGKYDVVGPTNWWSQVVRSARARGPRMFASLLCAIDRDILRSVGLA